MKESKALRHQRRGQRGQQYGAGSISATPPCCWARLGAAASIPGNLAVAPVGMAIGLVLVVPGRSKALEKLGGERLQMALDVVH